MAGQVHHSMRLPPGQGVGGPPHPGVGGPPLPQAARPHPGHQAPHGGQQQLLHQYPGQHQGGVIVSVAQQGPGHMAGPPTHQTGPLMSHMGGPHQQQPRQHHHVPQQHQGGPGYHQHTRQQHQPDHYRPPQHPHSVPPPTHTFHQQQGGAPAPLPSLPVPHPPPTSYQQGPVRLPAPSLGQLLDPNCGPPLSPGGLASSKEKTPMCLVNELARFNKVQHQYRLTDESGPAHKKTFTVCLKIGDKEEYIASGPSIKKAQHAASAIALEKTQFKHPSPKAKNLKNANITPTVELNALAMKRGEPTTYTFLEPNAARAAAANNTNGYNGGATNNYSANSGGGNRGGGYGQRTGSAGYPPLFCVQLRVGSRDFMGEGATAQAAKHGAAGKALKMLRDLPLPDGKSKLDPTSLPFVPGSEYDELKSPISLVHEIALKRNLLVQFDVTRETGPPHMRTFITKCLVGDFVTEGEGNGKKVSKKRAAELMLEQLKQLPPVASALVPRPRKVSNPAKKKARNLIKVETKEGCVAGGATGDLSINPISRLIQIQQARKEKEPQYILVSERGMPRRREFVMKVTVGQQSATGSGPNKKLAKRAAAEALLQLLGYSRGPSLQPSKPAIKSPGEISEKGKKLTFVDDVGGVDPHHLTGDPHHHTAGSGGRQLVPGLLYLDTENKQGYKPPPVVSATGAPTSSLNCSSNGSSQAATIAAELLKGGTSPTADLLASSSQPNPRLSCLPSQGVQPKEQLAYLSQVLGFSVSYTDFPKKGEYLSLVSLSTNPPQVCHGAGSTLEGSHNNAAHTALRTLANNGLDSVTNNNGQVEVSVNGLLKNGH